VTSSKLIRWGLTAVVVQSFLGPVLGYRCDEPANALADMNSMDDLRTRFNEAAGSPRLVLLLSPT
jgi:hypothetical protein